MTHVFCEYRAYTYACGHFGQVWPQEFPVPCSSQLAMSSAPSKRSVSLATSTQPAHKKARQGLTFDEVVRHNSLLRVMSGSDADKAKFRRVTIYTMAGDRCGPAGLGELLDDVTVDGVGVIVKDTRLTVPGHYSPSLILSMQPWCGSPGLSAVANMAGEA